MKIIGRIIIVLFLTAVLCTGIYFLFNGTQTSTVLDGTHSFSDNTLSSEGSGSGPRDGSGFHGGRNAEEVSSGQWLEVLQNVGIIGAVVVIVAVTRKVGSILKKKRIAIPPTV
jgi:hypothetical protein